MRLLEVFCGTKSVGKVANSLNWTVVSVDILAKFQPTHISDIMKFNYKIYPPGYFDFIWASPPCTEFSLAKTVGERDIKGATKIVNRAIQIIKYFKPHRWLIENPVGLLRHQPIMNNLIKYRNTVSYCKYGFNYRKNTDLWTNIQFNPQICQKGSYCKAKLKKGKHRQTVQGSHYVNGVKTDSGTFKLNERYSIPTTLIYDILTSKKLKAIDN
jgi:site-specific DNA-cytosine methylase